MVSKIEHVHLHHFPQRKHSHPLHCSQSVRTFWPFCYHLMTFAVQKMTSFVLPSNQYMVRRLVYMSSASRKRKEEVWGGIWTNVIINNSNNYYINSHSLLLGTGAFPRSFGSSKKSNILSMRSSFEPVRCSPRMSRNSHSPPFCNLHNYMYMYT